MQKTSSPNHYRGQSDGVRDLSQTTATNSMERHKKQVLTNLTPLQTKANNLGPAVMDTNSYIRQVLKEYVLTTELSHREAMKQNGTT
jgi:hypothetical protein